MAYLMGSQELRFIILALAVEAGQLVLALMALVSLVMAAALKRILLELLAKTVNKGLSLLGQIRLLLQPQEAQQSLQLVH
jgi:hypothetical protein